MIIKLKHDYFIEVDERNFTLKSEYLNKKTNAKATRTHGYYSSLESAIKTYINLVTFDAEDTHAVELNDILEKIKVVCEETIQTIKSQFKGE